MARQFSRKYSTSGTKIIQKILDARPLVLKYVLCCPKNGVPYAGVQMLKIVVSDYAQEALHTTPHDKIQCGLD